MDFGKEFPTAPVGGDEHLLRISELCLAAKLPNLTCLRALRSRIPRDEQALDWLQQIGEFSCEG